MLIPMLQAAALIDSGIQAGSHVETSIRHTTPLHYHDYYEIFIITDGQCLHQVNGSEQFLERGNLVFIRPEDRHSYDFCGDSDCRFVNINFYKDLVEDAFHYFGSQSFKQELTSLQPPPSLLLPSPELESILKKAGQLNQYAALDKPKARILAKSLLNDALTCFFLSRRDAVKKLIPAWFDTLLLTLQKKENFTGGLDNLPVLSGRSPSHLSRSFRQYLGTTPTAYLNRLKLEYAKSLLQTTQLSIVEAALEAGFDNLSHFYHLFRETFGVPPGKVRYK